MSGVKGRSGRRYQTKTSFNDILSFSDTVLARAMKDEEIPLVERAKIAAQFFNKRIIEKKENVNINLQISDELTQRMLDVMRASKPLPPPPKDIYITPCIEPNEAQD